MPRSLYERAAARGYPSHISDGLTGAGSLWSQGGPQNTDRHGETDPPATNRQTIMGFAPEPVADVEFLILDGAFGLPGSSYENATPRTHAAPAPGWAGDYGDNPDLYDKHAASTSAHAQDFGAVPREQRYAVRPLVDTDQWQSNVRGESLLQPVPGQIRSASGHYDADQGYDRANGYGFDAGHRDRTTYHGQRLMAYLDHAERPFIVPAAHGPFYPTDAVQGPLTGTAYRDAPGINATPQTAYVPPADPVTSPQPPQGAPASVGWW